MLKIQPQVFKSSCIKLITLLWSLVYSLIFTVFVGVIPKDSVYNASLGLIIGCGVVYLNIVIAYMLHNVRIDSNFLKVIWLSNIAYFVNGVLYKKIPFFIGLTSNENQCATRSCLVPIQIAQYILLGMVVVLYRFIPSFISKYYQSNLAKEHQTTEAKLQLVPEWILAAESVTLLVEHNALFTIIVNSIESIVEAPTCSLSAQLIGFWVSWASIILMYIFIICYAINSGMHKINCTSNFLAILLLGGFGSFLIGNDFNPLLLCYIKDSKYGHNGPSETLDISMKVNAVGVVFVAIFMLLTYVLKLNSTNKFVTQNLQKLTLPTTAS